MNKWISLLLLLLGISLALNFYLLSNLYQQDLSEGTEDKNNNVQQSPLPGSLFNWNFSNPSTNETSQASQPIDSDNPTNFTPLNPQATNRAELLAQANLWLKEKNLLTLGTFLQGYLKQYPQDMDFLLLEAKLKVETTLLSNAIAHYYDLLRSPMTRTQQSEIELQIEQLSENTIEQLRRNYSWDILAMFVEPLLQLAPNNRLYILSLAIAYAELYQEGLMENVLASLDFDDPDAQNIRKIILAQQVIPASDDLDESDEGNKNIDETADLGRPIPLKKFGDQYVV